MDAASKLHVTLADLPDAAWDTMCGHAQNLWGRHRAARHRWVDFLATDEWHIQALKVNATPGMSMDSNFITGARLWAMRGS